MTEGKYEITIYTSCCNTAKGIYYYTTYDNHQITAVEDVYKRQYRDWSTEKSYDLAWILEFMQAYHMTIPRYIKRTKFYRKKMKLLLRCV